MNAWVSIERRVDGKLKREKLPSGVRGIEAEDRFVVYYVDPAGKIRQERMKIYGKPGKKLADKRAAQLTAQLTLGEYDQKTGNTWEQFEADFEKREIGAKSPASQELYRESLRLFVEICKPKLTSHVTTAMVDDYRAGLAKRRGRKKGSKISPASVNKHLRHIRAALGKAHKWGYTKTRIMVELMREPEKDPLFMEPEHFDDIYKSCNKAKLPADPQGAYTAEQWWQALMVTGLMTGMRINEMLSLKWDDVRLDDGFLTVRHENSKAKRDDVIPLHSVAVEHLRKIQHVGQLVFEWPFQLRSLLGHWYAIQDAAGVSLPCPGADGHECTDACHRYGFHSLKRACGTLNASRVNEAVLGAFMRHASTDTTRRFYQNKRHLAGQITGQMFVPESLKK